MAEPYVHVVLFLLLVTSLPISIASPHKLRLSASDVAALEAHAPPPPDPPTTFFEVDRPHRPPPGSFGPCSTLLLSHSFAFTYTKPPVTTTYSPPPCLAAAGGHASVISLAVLEWRATCRGVQFDRIFGVWLGGAELLRSCTAEPRLNGIVWSVAKDITKYTSLLAAGNSTLAVYLGNLINDQFTGVYHANLTLHLYFRHPPQPPQPGLGPADVIVPISRSLPLNDGLWFQIHNNDGVGSASLAVPTNTYRAVIEVYLSYHSNDEFWYMNTPDQPDDDNGPFREVTVRIDGDIVGTVWPFPVIYTGGFNPLFWQPISGIGSFNLPSYDIELTPFLGKLLDGEGHEFELAVTNAQDVWFVDANLHLWLDPRSAATTASITRYDAPPLEQTIKFRPNGPGNEFYYTTAFRHISATGWVQTSSYGKITATWTQRFSYENTNEIQGSEQVVNQTTDAYSGVHVTDHAGVLYSQEAQQSFPLYIVLVMVNQTSNGSYTVARARNVQLGFGEERVAAGRSGFWSRSLSNAQDCAVNFDVEEGDAVGVSWGTHQTYRYEATDGCYFRDVASSRYGIVSDHSDEVCVKGGSSARAGAGGVPELAAAAGVSRLSS